MEKLYMILQSRNLAYNGNYVFYYDASYEIDGVMHYYSDCKVSIDPQTSLIKEAKFNNKSEDGNFSDLTTITMQYDLDMRPDYYAK